MAGGEEAEAPPPVELPPACMDLADFPPKQDFFDNMCCLDEKSEKLEGANNFRLVLCSSPSVPQPVVQSRRRPLLGPSPG